MIIAISINFTYTTHYIQHFCVIKTIKMQISCD